MPIQIACKSEKFPANSQITGNFQHPAPPRILRQVRNDSVLSHAVGLCRWEGRPLWRALRFTIGRAFTPTLQCYLGTVPCILDGFRLFIVQFFGRPAPSDLGGACIVSRSYPRQFTDFLLLRIRMRFPVPSPAAYRAGLFLYECRRCEPN